MSEKISNEEDMFFQLWLEELGKELGRIEDLKCVEILRKICKEER